MIRVTCEACGKSFSAKDELAGRKGKCPACGAPIVVPEAEASGGGAPASGDAPAPSRRAAAGPARRGAASRAAPAASQPPETPVAGTGRRVRRAGGRRSSGGKDYRSMGLVFAILAIVAVAAGYFFTRPGPGPDYVAIGLDHMSAGRLEDAEAAFLKVPADAGTYGKAQEYLAETRQLLAANQGRADTRAANNLYEIIKAVEKNYVSPDSPNYAANTRYMLKRCQEFLDRFPDDERTTEIKQRMYRFSDVASLDEPPTYDDMVAELNMRLISSNPDIRASMQAVDEFAALGTPEAGQAENLRARVRQAAARYWKDIRTQLESKGALAAGQEDWQRVANRVRRYLDAVEGVPGVTEAPEARALFEKALAQGG